MLTKEQLDAIKARANSRSKYRAFDSAINTRLLNTDVPALIEVVEKLMNVRDVSYAEYAELDAENKRLREFERKAIYVIEENKRLREALLLIQNSDTWLIEPSPTMHTIEEAYHACVGIADKALKGVSEDVD